MGSTPLTGGFTPRPLRWPTKMPKMKKGKTVENENAALLKNAEIRNSVLVKINENVVFWIFWVIKVVFSNF